MANNDIEVPQSFSQNFPQTISDEERKIFEEQFHDQWSHELSINEINVDKAVSACTAPELRYIFNRLGNVQGKKILDLGCGFGEASVHFARLGAAVTSLDISSGMLEQTQKLAAKYGVQIQTVHGDIEAIPLPPKSFDIIYAGNSLHHSAVPQVMKSVSKVLKDDGIFVSWDPLAYNPLINIYRWLAAEVRTPGEHPINMRDVRCIRSHFKESEISFYWLTTLFIFIHMFIVQFRNPRKERFWKKVLEEGDTWSGTYYMLEKIDHWLIKLCPPLGWLCWNAVIMCRFVK